MDGSTTSWQQLQNSEVYRRALDWVETQADRYADEITRICEIPAPPFAEDKRGEYVATRFRAAGLQEVSVDGAGNVLGRFGSSRSGGPRVLVSAHLDTVFPEGTDVRVRRDNGRLLAPGISDNSASVGALVYLAVVLTRMGFKPRCDLWFAANVGEEGLGDLRGMKFLFEEGLGRRQPVDACLILDGPMGMISHKGIGSRRLQVTFTGPGGHSWGDFGRPSAVHAAGRAMAVIDAIKVPERPRTTYNVGVVSGGTSVNAIAERAQLIIDMRSEGARSLARLEKEVRAALTGAAAERDGLELDLQVVGDRPMGEIPSTHPLVRIVKGAAACLGVKTRLVASSTDANVPLSLGIPAVAVGIKRGGGAHTLKEYLELDSLVPGFGYGLLALLGIESWLAGDFNPGR